MCAAGCLLRRDDKRREGAASIGVGCTLSLLQGKPMAAPAPSPISDPLRDLAAKIYIELICRNVVVTENAAQIKSNPESLAKISFKLAEAFQRVGMEVKAPSLPKNQEFDMKAADISHWNAAKPQG
ncbi:MAG TPA: hypothetical protein VGR01_07805 [Burkholderiales bacterium]|nr:hypothetical protein [Burkholderiales bacterium]